MSVRLTPQQRDAIDLPPEIAVSAAAGSGKTEVLVQRVIAAALGNGCDAVDLDRILVVTFTRAAAAELRERVRRALYEELARRTDAGEPLDPVRRQLAALGRAQISTIHSFCLDVVQRYGYLQGINAERVLDEDEARLLRHELAGMLLRQRLDYAGDELRAAALAWGGADGVGADDLSRSRRGKGLRELLLRLHDFRRSLPDPPRWFAQHIDLPPLDENNGSLAQPLVAAAVEPLREWAAELSTDSAELLAELHASGQGPNAAALLQRRVDVLQRIDSCSDWAQLISALEALSERLDLPYKPNSLLASYSRDVDDPELKARIGELATCLSSTVGSEAWNSRDLKSRPH